MYALASEEMSGSLLSLSGIAVLLLMAALLASALLIPLWLRLRRIRLQIEGRYLAGVAEYQGQRTPPAASEVLARTHGEAARQLLRGMVANGRPLGPASWPARGSLRYDQDERARRVEADSFCIPGVWWAQIRRVRLRFGGWIDEMHEVEGGVVTSGYWWLGLYRLRHPAARSSEFAVRAQALGESVMTPWTWFDGQRIEWDDQPDGRAWIGRTRPEGATVRLQLDTLGRPLHLELREPGGGAHVRVEYSDWSWSGQGLCPRQVRLIEAPGSVNEFERLHLQLGPVRQAPRPEELA